MSSRMYHDISKAESSPGHMQNQPLVILAHIAPLSSWMGSIGGPVCIRMSMSMSLNFQHVQSPRCLETSWLGNSFHNAHGPILTLSCILLTHTVILLMKDWLSILLKFILLAALPTAFELTELLFIHRFRYFGIPEGLGSDRGPQFMSWVWIRFIEKVGITISLTSGFYP